METIGKTIEMAVKDVPGTRSVYAERVSGGYFLDFNRRSAYAYGAVQQVQRYIGEGYRVAVWGALLKNPIRRSTNYPRNRAIREQ